MTYHYTSSMGDEGLEYNVHWRGKMDPIAVCPELRDARLIVEALNKDRDAAAALDWRRIEDDMPDDDELVLVVTVAGDMVMAAHEDSGWWDSDSILIARGVTHWARPTPPEGHPAFD